MSITMTKCCFTCVHYHQSIKGRDGYGICEWAPVKWVEGRLVVDIDRLRGES